MNGLIADIGGTNARFALVDANGQTSNEIVLPCKDYPTLFAACSNYLGRVRAEPRAGAFAVACPVTSDHVRMTNHVWEFSIEETRQQLNFSSLKVVNDFVAVALAAPRFGNTDLLAVGRGIAKERAVIALCGPGTGLGVSAMIPIDSNKWHPLTSEGGHVTMAATNDREAAVLTVIRNEFGHASAERLLSGPGLVNIYRAIATIDGIAADDDLTPPECTDRGLSNLCPICVETLELFCGMLGTFAANLAVTLNSFGGVLIAGGIVPRFGDYFSKSIFRARFEEKGRYGDFLADIPTSVIVRQHPAFVGLAGALEL